jgi:lipoate-protein ligase A
LYRWTRPTVTLGRFQDEASVDLHRCAELGVDVVRRFTGGRGVLHDDELTYAVVARRSDGVPAGVAASYAHLCRGLVETYRILGVDASVTSRDFGIKGSAACYLHSTSADLSVDARKLSGSAQVWFRDTVLQHGSFVRTRDIAREAEVFRLDQGHAELLGRAAVSLDELVPVLPDVSTVCDAAAKGFERGLDLEFVTGGYTSDETALADELEAEVRVAGGLRA